MIISVSVSFDHVDQKAGQVKGIGRRPDLIADDTKLIMVFSEIQHGFDIVLSVKAKDPCNPDDIIFFKNPGYRQFPLQFCLSVDIQGTVALEIRIPGRAALTVKNIVC